MTTRLKMARASHSPGPWSNDYAIASTGFGCGYGKSQITDVNGVAIAGVAAVEPADGPMYRDGCLSQETFDLLESNSRLIAAAPELLELAKDALKISRGELRGVLSVGDRVREENWNAEIRAVIAKATGK